MFGLEGCQCHGRLFGGLKVLTDHLEENGLHGVVDVQITNVLAEAVVGRDVHEQGVKEEHYLREDSLST